MKGDDTCAFRDTENHVCIKNLQESLSKNMDQSKLNNENKWLNVQPSKKSNGRGEKRVAIKISKAQRKKLKLNFL
jgi:hypothetical protein